MLQSPMWHDLLNKKFFAFCRFLYRRFNDVNVLQVAGSLTFTTLLALVPLFTVTVVIITAFPTFGDVTQRFNDFITSILIPAAGADVVRDYLIAFRAKASNLTAIGIIMMIITSLMLIQTIEQTFNRIWRVHKTRPIVTRFLVYWALLTLGPLAVGFGLSVWGMILKRSVSGIPLPLLSVWIGAISPIMVMVLLLFFLYKIVPFRTVSSRHALIGAVVTALCLELIRRGFTFYISNFNSYQLIYGAFSAIPVFLLWLNLLWSVLLTGAVFTAALPYWQGEVFRNEYGQHGQFNELITILKLLDEAQSSCISMKLADFRQKMSMGNDAIEDLLDQLADYQYVTETSDGWVLKGNTQNIQMVDLFNQFVLPISNQNDVANHVHQMLVPCLEKEESLADFLAKLRD